jgi:hypothetical protein
MATVSSALTGPMQVLLDEVVRDLVQAAIDESGEGVLTLPMTYPGGAPVVIWVRRAGEVFCVSDRGIGQMEAEHIGGSSNYRKLAGIMAGRYGVSLSGGVIFEAELSRDWVANAAMFVAAASKRAVEAVAEATAEERENSGRGRLQRRLREAFPVDRVSLNPELFGRSTKKHKFAAMVKIDEQVTLFDVVTPSANSVNSTIVKFQDVGRLEDAPRGVVMLSSKAEMAPADITLLSEAAGLILPLEVDVEELRRAA